MRSIFISLIWVFGCLLFIVFCWFWVTDFWLDMIALSLISRLYPFYFVWHCYSYFGSLLTEYVNVMAKKAKSLNSEMGLSNIYKMFIRSFDLCFCQNLIFSHVITILCGLVYVTVYRHACSIYKAFLFIDMGLGQYLVASDITPDLFGLV